MSRDPGSKITSPPLTAATRFSEFVGLIYSPIRGYRILYYVFIFGFGASLSLNWYVAAASVAVGLLLYVIVRKIFQNSEDNFSKVLNSIRVDKNKQHKSQNADLSTLDKSAWVVDALTHFSFLSYLTGALLALCGVQSPVAAIVIIGILSLLVVVCEYKLMMNYRSDLTAYKQKVISASKKIVRGNEKGNPYDEQALFGYKLGGYALALLMGIEAYFGMQYLTLQDSLMRFWDLPRIESLVAAICVFVIAMALCYYFTEYKKHPSIFYRIFNASFLGLMAASSVVVGVYAIMSCVNTVLPVDHSIITHLLGFQGPFSICLLGFGLCLGIVYAYRYWQSSVVYDKVYQCAYYLKLEENQPLLGATTPSQPFSSNSIEVAAEKSHKFSGANNRLRRSFKKRLRRSFEL